MIRLLQNLLLTLVLLFIGGYLSISYWDLLEKKIGKISSRFGKIIAAKAIVKISIPKPKVAKLVGSAVVTRRYFKNSLNLGDEVLVDDIIETNKATMLVLCFGNYSCMKIFSNSKVVIKDIIANEAEYEQSSYFFSLEKGIGFFNHRRMDNTARAPKLRVATPNVSMGVRGTQFLVAVTAEAEKSVKVAVNAGVVLLENEDHSLIPVKSSEGTVVDAKHTIAPPGNYEWVSQIKWSEHLAALPSESLQSDPDFTTEQTLEATPWLKSVGESVRAVRGVLAQKGLLVNDIQQAAQIKSSNAIDNLQQMKKNVGGLELEIDADEINKKIKQREEDLDKLDKENR
ncbi:MAG: FecR domain-containing protein [Oligoflexia bacterium]|nr:FecR domain-containing protein [Oligoflexia bacterium]